MNNHYVLNGGCAVAYPPYAGCTHIKGRVDKRSASTEIHAGCTHIKGRVDKRSAHQNHSFQNGSSSRFYGIPAMTTIKPLPLDQDIESKAVLKKLARAHQALAELKGVVASIPNQSILISTLSLQEAKDSSAIENMIQFSFDWRKFPHS